MKVLLYIEDEPNQRELTTRLFMMCNKCFNGEVSFRTAPDWESGMKIVQSIHVDVLLLDLVLPPMGKKETLEKMRRTPELPPVIVLTNSETDPQLREECIAYGAEDFILKREANHHPESLCEKAYHAYLRRNRNV